MEDHEVAAKLIALIDDWDADTIYKYAAEHYAQEIRLLTPSQRAKRYAIILQRQLDSLKNTVHEDKSFGECE